jgi:hypothetical protein
MKIEMFEIFSKSRQLVACPRVSLNHIYGPVQVEDSDMSNWLSDRTNINNKAILYFFRFKHQLYVNDKQTIKRYNKEGRLISKGDNCHFPKFKSLQT